MQNRKSLASTCVSFFVGWGDGGGRRRKRNTCISHLDFRLENGGARRRVNGHFSTFLDCDFLLLKTASPAQQAGALQRANILLLLVTSLVLFPYHVPRKREFPIFQGPRSMESKT